MGVCQHREPPKNVDLLLISLRSSTKKRSQQKNHTHSTHTHIQIPRWKASRALGSTLFSVVLASDTSAPGRLLQCEQYEVISAPCQFALIPTRRQLVMAGLTCQGLYQSHLQIRCNELYSNLWLGWVFWGYLCYFPFALRKSQSKLPTLRFM